MYNLSILLVASTALLTTVLGAPLESPKQFGGATTSVGGGAGKIAYKKVPMPAGGKPGEQYFQG